MVIMENGYKYNKQMLYFIRKMYVHVQQETMAFSSNRFFEKNEVFLLN